MTIIKSKLKKLLATSLVLGDNGWFKSRLIGKQVIKNIILDEFSLPSNLKSQSHGGFIRILATSPDNAKQIHSIIKKNQDNLGVQAVHIVDRVLEFSSSPKDDPIFNCSVLVRVDPKASIESIPNVTNVNLLRGEVFEDIDENHAITPERVVIDFSSPNIAKPFHFGHLKSTLLGNYLANLNSFLGNRVTKLNYIGDWGTQYGLLSLSLEEDGFKLPKESPLRYLLDVYIKANERAKSDDVFIKEAGLRSSRLEDEDNTQLHDMWQRIRDISLDELKNSYTQLGVEFDIYDCESNYAKKSVKLVDQLVGQGLAYKSDDGLVCIEVDKNDKPFLVPLLKSNGSSLYITRDIAAAISRKEQFNFDKMLYIVGADQEKHFHSLREIIRKLDHPWADNLIHVKMGKVLGMSTRSGNFVLLTDIIEETTKRYIEATRNVVTSKVSASSDIEETGKHLALSALFVYDLCNSRTRNYEFNWDQVMVARQRSGINLQTTYARLCSLIRKASEEGLHPYSSMGECQAEAIQSVEGMHLVSQLSELDTSLYNSFWLMDPSKIVVNALGLCKATNRARRSDFLMVLHEPDAQRARTKLTLFNQAKLQLELMIKLIGLKPLERV